MTDATPSGIFGQHRGKIMPFEILGKIAPNEMILDPARG